MGCRPSGCRPGPPGFAQQLPAAAREGGGSSCAGTVRAHRLREDGEMLDLDYVKRLAEGDHHLAVLTTTRPDGSVHASLVSAGLIDDPVDGAPSVGLVAIGNSRKLSLLRQSGAATIV